MKPQPYSHDGFFESIETKQSLLCDSVIGVGYGSISTNQMMMIATAGRYVRWKEIYSSHGRITPALLRLQLSPSVWFSLCTPKKWRLYTTRRRVKGVRKRERRCEINMLRYHCSRWKNCDYPYNKIKIPCLSYNRIIHSI